MRYKDRDAGQDESSNGWLTLLREAGWATVRNYPGKSVVAEMQSHLRTWLAYHVRSLVQPVIMHATGIVPTRT